MGDREQGIGSDPVLDQILGYLNFSSGATDPQFLANLNHAFELVARSEPERSTWRALERQLRDRLTTLRESSAAFRDAEQASAVLELVFRHTLPGYRQFHRDLLFHQTEQSLMRPFFIGRVCEAVLRQGAPWGETDRIVAGAINHLNDFIGHRPVAALESQKVQAYKHEFVRPIPLYIRGAGITYGPEREVLEKALQLLADTDRDLLARACFDPDVLEELAVDPRAYDFDHPANKRPNYHFGQWDPSHIDNQGRYRRFVVQQVTLDSLMQRLHDPSDLPRDELLFEAASVLAGTVLMASGISGDGPQTYESNVTLAKLLPRIARYRDEFYERLFQKTSGAHAQRLQAEADEKRQPFGGARQHLNAQLARRRASQLEHVHLARIFARMGHTSAAQEEADVVPCASARMLCQIDCLLATGHLACDNGQLEEAAETLPQIVDQLHRGIQCGAIIDPWNILGFDAHFSLFPAMENSVRDHRADELVSLMDRLWAFYSRVWGESAATNRPDVGERVRKSFEETANWWHQFAVHEVSTVEAVDALNVFRAAEHVAQAMAVWHKGGAATGDIAFWAPHAEMFDSPKAYALVIDALLDRGDLVASMSLLMHWLGQAERIGLERADSSFHELAQRWIAEATGVMSEVERTPEEAAKAWDRARKFLDYLEANAEAFWTVPQFAIGNGAKASSKPTRSEEPELDDEDEDANLYGSAYDEVVYRDSTDDGVQGSIFETEDTSHDELMHESKRVADRLAFLTTVARLWRLAALSPSLAAAGQIDAACPSHKGRLGAMQRWIEQAETNRRDLADLLAVVRGYRIPTPGGDHDSMVEYDRRRMTKESLLERIVSTCVETADASRALLASVAGIDARLAPGPEEGMELHSVVAVLAPLLRRDVAAVRQAIKPMLKHLQRLPLLYVPLSKGGEPREIVAVRVRQHAIQDLLAWLPRLGLWVETCELLEIGRQMEKDHPVGAGAVTEFDEMFKIGYKAIVESLVASSETWPPSPEENSTAGPLVACLEQLTEAMLTSWLAHSRTLRLSVLERVLDKQQWKKLVEFIERYGEQLFTQRFLNLGNIRAILHQGVGRWIAGMQEDPHDDVPTRLIDDLAHGTQLEEVAELLTLVLESIVENYGEYRDYNSTTTQSDRGELLYTLLDFLRLRTKYDRVCWNLKPVVLAHEILVRRGKEGPARVWRRALTDRIHDEADQYLQRLAELQRKYAMRMPTVADRLAESFVRPLAIDRIRALVEPAIEEARRGGATPRFDVLRHETESLTREPTGVGLDVPAWLVALEEEVDLALRPAHERQDDDLAGALPRVLLTEAEAREQLDRWDARGK